MSQVQLGTFTLEPHRELFQAGKPVRIGRKALDILSVLAKAGGGLVTKDELLEAVWPGIVIEENAIQVHVAALRRALGGEAHRIKTVHGLGYRIEFDGVEAQTKARTRADTSQRSVAILPFANLTGEPANDYLGDGLADELIVTLGRSTDLRVPARTSVFAYKGRDLDIRRIAQELNVGAVLEGSVRTAGDRVRITAQLINADTGFPQWSQKFDRSLDDLLALQDEMASAIAAGLSAHLQRGAATTDDEGAYHLYLQGRALWARPSIPNLRAAIELLTSAVGRDPNLARAYFTRGSSNLLFCLAVNQPIAWQDRVLPDIERALSIEPRSAEALSVLAAYHAQTGNWSQSTRAALDAAAFDPTDPLPHHVLSNYVLQMTGRMQAARESSRAAVALAPGWGNTAASLASLEMRADDIAEAKRLYERARDLGGPTGHWLNLAFEFRLAIAEDNWAEAASRAPSLLPESVRGDGAAAATAVVEAMAGKTPSHRAREAFTSFTDRLPAEFEANHVAIPGVFLGWWASLGDLDQAFAVADRLVSNWTDTGVLDTISLVALWSKRLNAFRADTRFQDLVERLQMFPYWEEFGPPDGYTISKGRLVES